MNSVIGSIHFGLGAAAGSIIGGYMYDAMGAVALFRLCSGLTGFSSLLCIIAILVGFEG